MAHDIHITGSNTSTGLLELSDGGHTKAHKGANVKWKIEDGNVSSIAIVPKDNSDDIWSSRPRRQGNRPNSDWHAKTLSRVPDDWVYRYSINWESSSGSSHTHDPIISMRPSGFDHRIMFAILVTAAAVAGICALKFLDRKKRR